MNTIDITSIIAIYGALLSTLTAVVGTIWSIYTYKKSQPALIITGLLTSHYIVVITDNVVKISISNSGQRPATITKIGIKAVSTKGNLAFSKEAYCKENYLPTKIEEAQIVDILVNPNHLGSPDNVEYIFAEDTTGKLYKSKKFPLYGQKYPLIPENSERKLII